MFLSPLQFLIVLVPVVALFWTIPPTRPAWRAWLLIGVSMSLVYAVAPVAMLVALGMSLATILATRLLAARHRLAPLWLIILVLCLPVAGFDMVQNLAARFGIDRIAGIGLFLNSLGLSYVLLKCLAVVFDCYGDRQPRRAGPVLLLNFFFPIYSAGPIEREASLAHDKLATGFDPETALGGVLRILVGLLKGHLLINGLIAPLIAARYGLIADPGATGYGPLDTAGFVLLRFFSLYLNFSAYTDIAIGAAALFNIKVMENFNFPFLAGNIQLFWTRWHMSLGQWVMQRIYYPLLVITRRPALTLFGAFVTIGLWHRITPQYLVWGLGHGGALAGLMLLKRRYATRPWYRRLAANPLYRAGAWALTLLWVALLSAFANADSFADGLRIAGRLVGWNGG